jgi:transcriptional antiterminator RfaH
MTVSGFEVGTNNGTVPTAAPWYVAYTRGRMEQTALFNLDRQGFEVYLPLFKACRNSAEGQQATFEVMFPRYVFLRPARALQSLSTVASTRGVCSLVRFGVQLAQVPSAVVEEIRKLEAERNRASLEEISPIQPGARVRLRKSGFRALEGLVLSVARQRVTFLMELLGREKQVTVAHGELELA